MAEPVTVELVDTARECVDQMDRDLAGLKVHFAKFTSKIKDILKSQKEMTSGSGMSHKWVLGAYWDPAPQLEKVA